MYDENKYKILNTSKSHLPFKFVSRNGNDVVYEAAFWDGDKQRYNYARVSDVIVDKDVFGNPITPRLVNTSPGVSYYSELKKKAKF